MAITLVKVNPKQSVASLSTLLTDNFTTIEENINKFNDVFNIGSGKFDNSTFGTDNNLKTGDIESIGSNGITITLGTLRVSTGNIILSGNNSRIEIGNNVKIQRITTNLSVSTVDTLDLSGTNGNTSGVGTVGPIHLPRLDNATILDIQTPTNGMIVWDETNLVPLIYDGTSWKQIQLL